ncbi:MAG: hypothetical protein FWH29_01880 [Methanobrevibacter sp.]|nr:hypothetical protein [Methanobrevibacter sp.]
MDESVNKMFEKTIHVLQDQREYLAYIRAEQADLDYKAQIKYATDKGREEEKIKIAIKLKKLDYPLKEIAKITGMPVKEIKKL